MTLTAQTVKYLHCLQRYKCFLKKKAFFFTVVSSDPALECLPLLESRLQETNNLPAFLANVRREFISLARRWDWEKWFRKRSAQSAQTDQIQATAPQNFTMLSWLSSEISVGRKYFLFLNLCLDIDGNFLYLYRTFSYFSLSFYFQLNCGIVVR